MKNKALLLASMLILSSYGFAQKMSPSTSLMLQDVKSGVKKAKAANGKENTVNAFINVKSQDAIAEIVKLGANINSQISETLVTATVPMSAIERISQVEGVESFSIGTEARLLMDRARKLGFVDDCHEMTASNGNYTGKGVVVGIVDNGFQYDHVDFLTSDKSATRIKRIWDQSGYGNAPEGFKYGVEYKTQEEFNSARFDMTAGFHATHVAGIAAGADKSTPYYGVAPDADLVFVSFKNDNACIVDGIKYVFDYAESVGKPAVVNISLGSHVGPHDGTSNTDLSFAKLVGPGRIIVGAAGNEGLDKLHVSKTLTASSKQLKTMFAYADETNKQAYVDIWGDKNAPLSVKAVVVNTLNGKIVRESEPVSTDPDSKNEVKWIVPDGAGVVATVGLAIQRNPNNGRANVLVFSRANSINDGFAIGFVATAEAGNTIHAWNNAQGCGFTNMNKRGWTDGSTDYTVGELGGESPDVISVGSYNSNTYFTPIALQGTGQACQINQELVGGFGEHSKFSSYGPTADGRIKPDVCAPGCIVVSAGSRYSGSWSDETNVIARSGQDVYTYDVGTSMASPFVAGTVALWLQANPNLTPKDVIEVLSKTSRETKYMPEDVQLPDNTYGYGYIDACGGLKYVLGETTGITETTKTDKMFSISTNRAARTATFSFGSGKAQVEIYNTLGQKVFATQLNNSGETVNLSSLAEGIYVIKLIQGNNVETVKAAL